MNTDTQDTLDRPETQPVSTSTVSTLWDNVRNLLEKIGGKEIIGPRKAFFLRTLVYTSALWLLTLILTRLVNRLCALALFMLYALFRKIFRLQPANWDDLHSLLRNFPWLYRLDKSISGIISNWKDGTTPDRISEALLIRSNYIALVRAFALDPKVIMSPAELINYCTAFIVMECMVQISCRPYPNVAAQIETKIRYLRDMLIEFCLFPTSPEYTEILAGRVERGNDRSKSDSARKAMLTYYFALAEKKSAGSKELTDTSRNQAPASQSLVEESVPAT